MTETIQNKNTENKMTEGSRAVLVGAVTQGTTTDEVEAELEELSGCLTPRAGTAVARVIQNLQTPDPRTLIGSGKVKEIAGLCKNERQTSLSLTWNCLLRRSEIWKRRSVGMSA